ncbi:hypothetical protein GCM10012275_02290 [Longimycelium tulufanense]|uniref:Uncharacterized protein n=2 Tax=Longimycelium tulufanense TaxID=907463 RepID=A0A8J3C604_9PSEU|nr:hypothetical protein GCM10012275_02290 [Longimycelium tulufanense]
MLEGTWRVFVSSVGALFTVSGVLGGAWQFQGRRAFKEEILETTRVARDVISSGLVGVGTSYLHDLNWRDLLGKVKHLDLLLAYGDTWRRSNIHELRKLGRKKGRKICIFLPDVADAQTVETLSWRFGMTQDELIGKIEEARQDYELIRVSKGATVRIYYYPGDRYFSLYRLDQRAVLTLYSHGRDRRPVPTLIFDVGGSLYKFVEEELEDILRRSRAV